MVFTAGQRPETGAFAPLMAQGAVARAGRGRARLRPQRLIGDKAYSSHAIRRWLRDRGIRYTIPRRVNETRTGPFDRAVYRLRNRIERLINRLKQSRRIATRYEKRVGFYEAMWLLGAILLWL